MEVDRAIQELKALRRRFGKITRDELLSARDAGRKDPPESVASLDPEATTSTEAAHPSPAAASQG